MADFDTISASGIPHRHTVKSPKSPRIAETQTKDANLRSGQNPLVFSMNFEQSKEALGSALTKRS